MSALIRRSILLCALAPLTAAAAAPVGASARATPHQFEFGVTAMGLSGMAPEAFIGPGAGMAGFAGTYGYRVAHDWLTEARLDFGGTDDTASWGLRSGVSYDPGDGVGAVIGPWVGYRRTRTEWTDTFQVPSRSRRTWGPFESPEYDTVEGTTVRHSLTAGVKLGLAYRGEVITSTLAFNTGTALLTDADTTVSGPGGARPDPDQGGEFDLTWAIGFRW